MPESNNYNRLATLYLLSVVLFMVIAAATSWPMPEISFRSDNSPVSWLSSAQLWAGAVISGRLLVERALPGRLALVLFSSMVLMSFDEQFMFHELWKYTCSNWFSLCKYSWMREMPMVLVAIGGVAITIWLSKALVGWGRWLLILGVSLGMVALSKDVLGSFESIGAYEEAVEVLAEALFISSLLGIRAKREIV
ncbi:MAG: hypothetical protein QM808_07670 [Steroidobacteraceae bacterium]